MFLCLHLTCISVFAVAVEVADGRSGKHLRRSGRLTYASSIGNRKRPCQSTAANLSPGCILSLHNIRSSDGGLSTFEQRVRRLMGFVDSPPMNFEARNFDHLRIAGAVAFIAAFSSSVIALTVFS